MSGSADTPETPAQGALFAQRPQDSVITAICEWCRVPLSGKQKRFHSDSCRVAWWNEKHPRLGLPLTAPGEPRQAIRARILGILMDRAWHTLRDLSLSLGVAEATVSAKLRDLRKAEHGAFEIEHRTAAVPYSRHAHEYRLVRP